MAALAKIESLYQEDLNRLLQIITKFEEGDENAEACQKFAMSHLLFNNYLSANKWEVNRKIDGIANKLQFHGFPGRAEKLKFLVEKFICLKQAHNYEQVDLEWQILKLLLCLAYRPSHALEDVIMNENEFSQPLDAKLFEQKEKEMWAKYLREDDNKFSIVDNEVLEDWSDLDSEDDEISVVEQNKYHPEKIEQPHYPPLFPRIEPVIKYSSKKEYVRLKIEESIAAEDRLRKTVQHSWWNIDEQIAKLNDDYSPIFIDLITSWKVSSEKEFIMVLSEKKILKEILWTLNCPMNEVLFSKSEPGHLEVRKNFSLPTISQESSIEVVNRLTHLLRHCSEMLDFRETLDFFKSSFTLQAYSNTLVEVLQPFVCIVLNLQKQINQQDCSLTLADLDGVLRPFYFDLEFLYQIHVKATSKHESHPNWLAVARLLSHLESGLAATTTANQTNILLRLYITSLRVYIDIIDSWLSEGYLNDFRQEFLIFRSEEDRTDELPSLGSFVVRRAGIESFVLDSLVHSVLKAARSLEFAQNISDIYTVYQNISDKGSLYEQFLSKIGCEISDESKISEINPPVEIGRVDEGSCVSTRKNIMNKETNVRWQKEVCRHNPFMFKSFETLSVECERRAKNAQVPEINLYNKYIPSIKNNVMLLPLNLTIESILHSLITAKHDPAALQLKEYLITNASLLTHLEILHKVFLLESGHTLVRFYTKMFSLVEADLWQNAESLSPILEDCIENDIGEYSERFQVTSKENCTPEPPKRANTLPVAKAIRNLDHIFIDYQADWPVSIVITKESLNSYNILFRFLSKIEWALWSLQQLSVKDLKKSAAESNTKRLFLLRFWLLHSVSYIHTYFVRQVFEDFIETLKREIFEASSLDTVLIAHKNYLKKLCSHCLNEDFTFKRDLFPFLSLCGRLRKLWNKEIDGTLRKEALLDFEKRYIKSHLFLTNAVESMVNLSSSKSTESLTELWKVLSSNVPVQCDLGSKAVFFNLFNFVINESSVP